jgi:RimJ/RimL family protein N-acetyltransferase
MRHADDLWTALEGPEADEKLWDYMIVGPFRSRGEFDSWLQELSVATDSVTFCILDLATNRVNGMIALVSIDTTHGRVEIGRVTFGAAMQRTPKSTEAVFLLAQEAFALGNRRVAWKCNVENERSSKAALRLGFTYEGTFRQHMVVRGENRDSAWYSIIDTEWPSLKAAFQLWLGPENQTNAGQLRTLAECRLASAAVNKCS